MRISSWNHSISRIGNNSLPRLLQWSTWNWNPNNRFRGEGQDLAIRNYNGGITLTNKTGSENVSIDLNSGQVILTNTVTSGVVVVVRGVGKLIDESGDIIHTGTWNGVTIYNETISPHATADAVWDRQTSDNQASGSFGELVSKKLLTLAKYLGLK